MGYGMPAAIGAQIGCPKSAVVAIVGDGGFLLGRSSELTFGVGDLSVFIDRYRDDRCVNCQVTDVHFFDEQRPKFHVHVGGVELDVEEAAGLVLFEAGIGDVNDA